MTGTPETAVTLPEHAAPTTVAPTDVGELPPDLLADADFALRYVDGTRLGEGGMGVVRACTDRRIGREVAMKIVRPGDGSRGDLKARFLREACVQGQLEHPAIVPVYDLGRDPDGTLYFTMKRVRGSTFERIVDALRARDPEAARQFSRHKLLSAFVAVCHAVDFAHARGVVHRDLKPANVMLGDYGEVYVLDWGLAKVVGAPEPRLSSDAPAIASGSDPGAKTVHGATMGTPGYMAPEQLRGETVDARVDVYALGAILFELLALESLHPHGTAEIANTSTLRGADARPSVRAPDRDVPPELDDVCEAATRLDAEARTKTVREVIDAVERYLEGDRDLVRRKTLAREHVRAASEHARRALGPGPAAARARSLALREIGRAVALDPTDREAVSALMHLMTEAPAEMPAEASENMRVETRRGLRFAARGAAISYLSWFAYLPFMLWAGVRSWLAWGIASAAWLFGAWAAYRVSRKPPHAGSRPFLMTAAGVLGVAATSTLWGPYVLVPSLAAVGSMLMHMSPDRRGRVPILLANCLAIAVPALLQAVGVLPPSYAFGHDTITILPVMVHFSPVATQAFLAVGSISLVITASLMVARIRDTLTTLEERLYVHTWQLRQLVPDQARSASAHPAMETVESMARLPDSDRSSDV